MATKKVISKQSSVISKKKENSSSPITDNRSPKTHAPQTMEELLAATSYTLKGVKKGDVMEGKITRGSRREMTIDIGGKTEGVVIDRELETYRDMLMSLNVGDTVVAQVIVAENDRGQSVLSLRRSIFEKRWAALDEKQKNGEVVEVTLKEPVRGGILVDYGGLRGYIPQSQMDGATAKQAVKVVNRRIQAKVVEVDRDTNRLVFSQRAVTEGATLAKQKAIFFPAPYCD